MAKKITTGVALSLKDGFSPAIRKAGEEAKGFAGQTLGAINSVDKAFSGMGTKLAAFGLSFSLGAVTKDIIELDHRMTRLGLTANAGAEQIAALKKEIFKAAKAPDIKIDPTEIVSALDVIMTKTGDLKFAEANVRNVALAMQAAGEAGGPMGDVFAEFAKNGYSAGEISKLLDDMIAQSDQGEFTFAEFAKNAKGVLSAYSAIGNSPDDVKRANAAMQILTAGTKSAEVATTVLNSAVNELLDPKKRDAVEKLGIKVRDIQTGNLRDFNDIMAGLAEASNDLAKADIINSLFGSETLKAVRAYNSEFGRKLKDLLELGDTAGKMSEKSARMAGTLKSNIQELETALCEFADANLAGPLAKITETLNELTARPERMKRLFTEITVGLGAIAAVKGIAGIARVFEGMKGARNGALNITESLNMASAMPVYVTNWGGAGLGVPGVGVSGVPAPGGGASGGTGGGLVDQYGRPVASRPNAAPPSKSAGGRFSPNVKGAAKGAGGAALVSAAVSGVGLAVELSDIEKNEEMSAAEKSAARGGAGGQFAGDVAGAAAGAFVGTLIMPGVGTMIGGMLGGWLGGKAGRFIGEKLGVTIDRSGVALDAAKAAYESAARELEAAVAERKTAAEVEAAGRKLHAARAALAEAGTKQNEYDAAKEAAKKAGDELAAAVASRMKPEETAELYQALAAANAALKAAEAALKGPETPAKAAKPKGHYEYAGVNGIPKWVAPEIPAAALSAAVAGGIEPLIPQEPPKALLTGAVDLNITVDGGRTHVTAKTNTPLFKPNMGNCGNAFYGREVSP